MTLTLKPLAAGILLGLIQLSPMTSVAADDELAARVARMETLLNNQGMLNLVNEIEQLNQEVRQLRGQVEEQAYTIKQLEQRQQSLYDDLDSRISSSPQTGTEASLQTPPPIVEADPVESDRTEPLSDGTQTNVVIREEVAGVAESAETVAEAEIVSNTSNTDSSDFSGIQPVETYRSGSQLPAATNAAADQIAPVNQPAENTAPLSASPDQAEDDYAIAFSLLKEGKHDQAVDQFRQFLQTYPDSDYADNAQYWLGESYYARRQYQEALQEYKSLLKQYPDSGKASHAQLKIGYSLHELGQTDLAQGELEDLIARYPGTSAAQLADERLRLIRSQ